jgi:hypothetical protein
MARTDSLRPADTRGKIWWLSHRKGKAPEEKKPASRSSNPGEACGVGVCLCCALSPSMSSNGDEKKKDTGKDLESILELASTAAIVDFTIPEGAQPFCFAFCHTAEAFIFGRAQET